MGKKKGKKRKSCRNPVILSVSEWLINHFVSHNRLLLQDWVDDLTTAEVEEMRFLAAAHLSRRTELEEAETAQEVFTVLEKNQVRHQILLTA